MLTQILLKFLKEVNSCQIIYRFSRRFFQRVHFRRLDFSQTIAYNFRMILQNGGTKHDKEKL